MFNFKKYALVTSPPNHSTTTQESNSKFQPLLTGISFGDMLLILQQVEDNDQNNSSSPPVAMSYVQRVNIHALHKHGYKLYDHRNRPQKPQLFSTCGWIPTSYLTTILIDPLVCSPQKSLDLSRALVDREEDIEQAEIYQKEHGMKMDNYESFCRDVYQFELWNDVEKVSKGELDRVEKVSAHRAYVHCLEAPKYDEFNIDVESFEKRKEEWRKLANEKFEDFRDVFFVKNSKHPGYLHWLIKSAYISETIVNALNAFGDRPCLGYRRRTSATELETFHRWFTFEQLHERVMRFGLGLYQLDKEFINQPRPFPQEEGRGFVGICSSNRPDWFVADWACLTQSFISVALPQTKVDCISEDIINSESEEVLKSISHEIICIINNSQIPLLVCSRDLTVKFLKLIKHGLIPSVKTIIQMEDFLVKEEEFDETIYKNSSMDELTKYLKNLRVVHQQKLKEEAKILLSQEDNNSSSLYYLMKNRYKNSNLNMNVSIEDLCHFNKSENEFVIQNYISENDFNLDCKSILLAKELSIDLKDMASIELSTFKEYPTFNESLRFNIRTNHSVNDLTTIVYTSGSTSTEPKGAVMTDKQYNENVQMEIYHYHPLVFISYAPLSHITDRMNTTACMVNGGRSGFNCGEMDKVFDDYQSIQPVTESNTPRFYNILYAEYQRLKALEGDSLTPEKEELIMQKMRNMLGGRIKSLVTGGASTSPQVVQFLKDCFKCNVYNGYSSTECGYIGPIGVDGVDYLSEKIQEENKKLPRHIMRLKDVEIKLESVPELGYYITDMPFPRGEICVKSSSIISGYYRDTEKTKLSFDSENYFQTADIGEIDKEKLRLRIIDRKKNIFKLSQGEFVAPENLENLFITKTLFVDQIYLYGNSEKSFLVAVIVPKNFPLLKEKAQQMAMERNQLFEDSNMSRSGFIYKVIQDDLNKCAREAKLESYEIPKGFIIEREIFTPENGKMTASYKLCRPALVKSYKETLEELYKEIEGEDMSTLDQVSNKSQLEEFLKKLFESGGVVDSLSSVRLSNILSQKFNVKLGADKILQECKNSENPALSIMQMIEKLMEHGQDSDEIFSTDEELFEEVQNLIKEIPIIDENLSKTIELNKNRNILITGATGFIGVGLVCEQLFINPDSLLKCIIRGKSMDEERNRLLGNVLNYCYHFSQEEKNSLLETFDRRVSIILGDISLNQFGLDPQVYKELENEIDTVIHCGANVNFIMNYTQLKQVNVQSAIECLKLCTSQRIKHLHFVSTISVIPYSMIDQFKDSNKLVPQDFIPLSLNNFNDLSDGYPQSKYIAEHALRLAMEQCNFSHLKIYRPGLVVGHTINGFSSVREWITRLICGFVHLGEIPIEYSKHGMQVIPVNCCAKGIIDLVNNRSKSNSIIHHLVNWNNLYRTIDNILVAMKNLQFEWKFVNYKTWIQNLHTAMNNGIDKYPQMTKENSIFGIIHMFPLEHDLLTIDSTMEEHVCQHDLMLNNVLERVDDSQLVEREVNFLLRTGNLPKQELLCTNVAN